MCVHYQCNIWIYVFNKHTIFGSCHNINGNLSKSKVGLLLAIVLVMNLESWICIWIWIHATLHPQKQHKISPSNLSVFSSTFVYEIYRHLMRERYHSKCLMKLSVILQRNDQLFCVNKGGYEKRCIISASITYILGGLASPEKFCVFFVDAVHCIHKNNTKFIRQTCPCLAALFTQTTAPIHTRVISFEKYDQIVCDSVIKWSIFIHQ